MTDIRKGVFAVFASEKRRTYAVVAFILLVGEYACPTVVAWFITTFIDVCGLKKKYLYEFDKI